MVPDEFALLSAIWIMASNDDTPLMTYESLRARLTLPSGYDLTGLVGQHPELFRRKMQLSALNEWKTEMLAGKRLPAFIRDAPATDRVAMIAALKPEDGFRSQFRASRAANRSDVAVIEWGLNHIERLRKASFEVRDATARSGRHGFHLPPAS